MKHLRALAYADRRGFVNDLRCVLHSRGRMLLWSCYGIALVLLVVSRTLSARRLGAGTRLDLVRADFFMSALLVTLALALAGGRGPVGIFRTRAQARFIIGSPVPAPLAIAYLQARAALAGALRLIVSLFYFIFIFGPRAIGVGVFLADLVLMLALLAAAAAVAVPRRLLPRPAAIVCTCIGGLLALAAGAPALRDAAIVLPLPTALTHGIVRFVPALHPGGVLLRPQPLWLLGAIAIATAAIAILASAGRDAYPELYALSMARLDRFERRRRRWSEAGSVRLVRRAPALVPAPAGVLVYVWKSVVEFRRQRQRKDAILGVVLWCAAGFGAARLLRSDSGVLFWVLVNIGIAVMLLTGIGATGAITREIRRPLFWLSETPLFERLCALAAARSWRTIVTLELVATGFAAGGGTPFDTLVVGVALPVLVALLASVGFAAYALVPSAADARGPVAALRLGVSVLLLIPPLTIAVVAILLGAALLGAAAFTVVTLIEAGALIGLAAWRLDGRIDRLSV